LREKDAVCALAEADYAAVDDRWLNFWKKMALYELLKKVD
jgi:hypothetical protein